MKIGILGTRGIPNAYGGFEQFAQYLARGLSDKGHAVYVYNSSDHPYQEKKWEKVHILHCSDWESRIGMAGQFIYDYNCLRDASTRNFDILFQLGYTSNSIWHWLWPRKAVNIVNMDGLEWKRSKYNKATRIFLRFAEKWAAVHADVLVADSVGIRDHIIEKYKRPSVYLPYGAVIPDNTDPSSVIKRGLLPHNYFLIVARLEPENNIEMIIEGYLNSKHPFPLVIIGNPNNKFGKYLSSKYDMPRIIFMGAIYDAAELNSLRAYSAFYFHGHSVGGTNPSLLEAMACGCNIAANDNIFNKAILKQEAFYFSGPQDICSLLNAMPGSDNLLRNREINILKIETDFNWNKIISDYEKLFIHSGRQNEISS